MYYEGFLKHLPHPVAGIEGAHRILEHRLDAGSKFPDPGFVQGSQILSEPADLPGLQRDQSEQRAHQSGFSAPRLPH